VAIRDALTKRDDLDFREDLGWTRFFQGWVEYRGGDRTKAAPIYRDAIAELEPVVLARGKGSEVGEKLAQTYRRLGDLLNETGDAAGARSQYLLALELDEARLAEKPTLAAAQMNVTRTWRRLGQLARQSGERAEAMGWLTRTVELREQLATGLVSASVQHNLAVALEDLGQAQLEAGACAAAAATLRRAVERCDIGLSMDTEDVLIVQESAVCRCRLSAALACAGDASEAAAAGANAVAMIDQALARPSTPTTLRAIAAMALVEVEPPALRDPTRALALIESALAESGGNDLSMWETKANALAMLGRRAEAAEAERRVIDLIAPGDVRRRAAAEARRAEFLAPAP
jgi:tetratricopeptide (TPR) repeat protein